MNRVDSLVIHFSRLKWPYLRTQVARPKLLINVRRNAVSRREASLRARKAALRVQETKLMTKDHKEQQLYQFCQNSIFECSGS